MATQSDFFTVQSLATFSGTLGATTLIANGLQRAFNFNPAWLALVVAECVCLATVFVAQMDAPVSTPVSYAAYFVAMVNGFLVFCTAAGTTSLGAAALEHRQKRSRGCLVEPKRTFFTPWF